MAYERFNADNAAMLLIDHQVGTLNWMHSAPKDEVKRNTLALAKAAKAVGMPVLLTSSMEWEAQGPLFPEFEAILPAEFEARIKRAGIVDAFDDADFAEAVRALGRQKLIMAGLLTEVCVVYPALNAADEGYEIQVIADASGSATKVGDEIALDRMRQAGVAVASTVQMMSEMVSNWAEGAGPQVMPVLSELYAELAA
ncbi:MAG: isochorismatase hydrolase [Candidatus Entotheonella factor]|uniref:Isochorismatase hydrolase n=1 Tax=Entotheonella factor TaxID=1429438 RepID=W4L972_ENTF1|nr:isochorismatase family protein [Candidatus Entotheonella palauensis]ETW94582.1 MAG: isochorismatase hydrolase [Candidatus Entotheonella factor]